MVKEEINTLNGDKIHRVRRSMELQPEVIKLENKRSSKRGFNSPLILFYGLIALIGLGTLILFLPISVNSNQNISLVDSFFVSTSAVTVTGLTPVQSEVTWSIFGLGVIAILSFIGGLGFMIGAGFLIYILFGKKINLEQKMLINESLSDSTPSKYVASSSIRVVLNIFYISIVLQVLGSALFYLFWKESDINNEHGLIFNAIFHSISSFNGAGFDILADGNGGSIGSITNNNNLLAITMILIFLGSIGYPIILEFSENIKLFFQSKFKQIFVSLNFKVVVFTTIIVLITGMLQFLFAEWSNQLTIGLESTQNKIIYSVFHAITRTAGFSIIDYDLIHNSTTVTTMALMFIGGGSLSVAGGIKVGTLTIILTALISTIMGEEEITLFKRTITREITRRALIIFIFSIFLILFSFIVISSFEPDSIFRELLFECVSAFGNVGLTTGITEKLNDFSKIFISFLMIIGRFGPLLLALMFVGKKIEAKAKPAYEVVRLG